MRTYFIKLRHDNGVVRLSVLDDSAADAVRRILHIEHAPMRAVVSVSYQPTCDYCTALATLYAKDGDTPLCRACAKDHYTSVSDSTGKMGVSRFVVVPESEWRS